MFCAFILWGREGAFFVPYVIFFVCCGIPVFFLETAMGQFTSEGGITCWRKVCPLFEGEPPSLVVSHQLMTAINDNDPPPLSPPPPSTCSPLAQASATPRR